MTIDELFGMSQKAVSLNSDLKLQLNLANSLTGLREKARLASLGLAHANLFHRAKLHTVSSIEKRHYQPRSRMRADPT